MALKVPSPAVYISNLDEWRTVSFSIDPGTGIDLRYHCAPSKTMIFVCKALGKYTDKKHLKMGVMHYLRTPVLYHQKCHFSVLARGILLKSIQTHPIRPLRSDSMGGIDMDP